MLRARLMEDEKVTTVEEDKPLTIEENSTALNIEENTPSLELTEKQIEEQLRNGAGENNVPSKAGSEIKRAGERPHVQWEDLEGIKQVDIIDYMMNEWFIKAMNKTFSAACYGVEWLYKHGEYKYEECREDARAAKAKTKAEREAIEGTSTFKETVKMFDSMSAEIKTRHGEIDKKTDIKEHTEKVKEALNKYIANPNDPNAFDGLEPAAQLLFKAKVKSLSKEDVKMLAKTLDPKKEQKNTNEFRKMDYTIGMQIAAAEMAENLAKGGGTFSEDDLKIKAEEYAKLIRKTLDKAASPEAAKKLMETYKKLSSEALGNATEAHKTGKIGQNTPENKPLNKLKNIFNISNNSHYEKMGLYRYSKETGVILDREDKVVNILGKKSNALEAQKEILKEKKKRLEALKEKYKENNNPDKAKDRGGLVSGRKKILEGYYQTL